MSSAGRESAPTQVRDGLLQGDHEPEVCTPRVFAEAQLVSQRLAGRALAEDMISMSKAAELMAMSIGQLRERLRLEAPRAAAHQC
ncbi:MAG: hypothetical protein DRJ42_24680 [Deltaproteobacteria bacterium]|nr:MAG: hypothetical protein DRJ42_24680 [Deltaproteobacteria bacterium]